MGFTRGVIHELPLEFVGAPHRRAVIGQPQGLPLRVFIFGTILELPLPFLLYRAQHAEPLRFVFNLWAQYAVPLHSGQPQGLPLQVFGFWGKS